MSKSYTLRHPRIACDTSRLKMLWEKKIRHHSKQLQEEELRVSRSALGRLRSEWARRLEGRNKLVQCTLEDKGCSLLPIEPFHTEDKTAA